MPVGWIVSCSAIITLYKYPITSIAQLRNKIFPKTTVRIWRDSCFIPQFIHHLVEFNSRCDIVAMLIIVVYSINLWNGIFKRFKILIQDGTTSYTMSINKFLDATKRLVTPTTYTYFYSTYGCWCLF